MKITGGGRALCRSLLSAIGATLCLTTVGVAACTGETAGTVQASGVCPERSVIAAESSLPSGELIEAEVSVYDRAACVPPELSRFWGSTDVPVRTFIGDLRITRGGDEVWVPLSSYVDLGDPQTVSVEQTNTEGFAVVVRGQGDSGYVAQIVVRGETVVERRLYNPAFAGESGERTAYTYPADW